MKKEIIEEALRLFSKNGVDFKMIDVATNIGISKKTIYKFFTGKEDLLIACLDYIFNDIYINKEKIFNDDSLDPLSKLKKYILAKPSNYDSFKIEYLASLNDEFPIAGERLNFHIENGWENIYELIDVCKKQNLIREVDNMLIRLIIVASSEKMIHLKTNKETFKELQAQVLDVIIDGIRTKN